MLFRSTASLFGSEIIVPAPGEYVANGAAKQAAWALLGLANAPQWKLGDAETIAPALEENQEEIVSSYLELISSI